MAMNIKPDPSVLSMLSTLNAREAADARTVNIGRSQDTGRGTGQQNQGLISGRSPAVTDSRVPGGLSSPAELAAAKQRAIDFTSTNREAPFGRLSSGVGAQGQRTVPLGQIIDIRV